jgi:hypothetical protein
MRVDLVAGVGAGVKSNANAKKRSQQHRFRRKTATMLCMMLSLSAPPTAKQGGFVSKDEHVTPASSAPSPPEPEYMSGYLPPASAQPSLWHCIRASPVRTPPASFNDTFAPSRETPYPHWWRPLWMIAIDRLRSLGKEPHTSIPIGDCRGGGGGPTTQSWGPGK